MSKIYTHMPILREGFEVSMELLSERWADKNHGQTRQRLAQRGGLSPAEAVAVMECRPWRPMEDKPAMEVLRDAQRALDAKLATILKATAETGMWWSKDHATGNLTFAGTLLADDFAGLKLNGFDRALLADCEGPDAGPAEWLLALEMIFRRLKELPR